LFLSGDGTQPAEEAGDGDRSYIGGTARKGDLSTCEKYAALGVHRLILMPSAKLDADGLERYVETVGEKLVGRM
jgi:hypothetical protein